MQGVAAKNDASYDLSSARASDGAAEHALEADGRSRGKNGVASPASLFLCGSTALRRRALRPQL